MTKGSERKAHWAGSAGALVAVCVLIGFHACGSKAQEAAPGGTLKSGGRLNIH